jgi:hypothetical protein
MWAANSFIESIPENQWYDYSELSRIIGWSTYSHKNINVKYVNSILHVVVSLEGTSNSTTTSFTLPIATCWESLRYFNGALFFSGYAVNNSVVTYARLQPLTNPNNGISYDYTIINCGYGVVGGVSGAWTASGTKRIGSSFVIPIM